MCLFFVFIFSMVLICLKKETRRLKILAACFRHCCRVRGCAWNRRTPTVNINRWSRSGSLRSGSVMLRLPQTLHPPWIQMKLQTLACFQWDSTWIMVVWLKLTFLVHVCTEWRRLKQLPGVNRPFFRSMTLSFSFGHRSEWYLYRKTEALVHIMCLWPGDFCSSAASEYRLAEFMFQTSGRSFCESPEKIVFTVSSSIYSFTLKWFHYPETFQLLIFSSCTPVNQLCTQHWAHLALCLQPTALPPTCWVNRK